MNKENFDIKRVRLDYDSSPEQTELASCIDSASSKRVLRPKKLVNSPVPPPPKTTLRKKRLFIDESRLDFSENSCTDTSEEYEKRQQFNTDYIGCSETTRRQYYRRILRSNHEDSPLDTQYLSKPLTRSSSKRTPQRVAKVSTPESKIAHWGSRPEFGDWGITARVPEKDLGHLRARLQSSEALEAFQVLGPVHCLSQEDLESVPDEIDWEKFLSTIEDD